MKKSIALGMALVAVVLAAVYLTARGRSSVTEIRVQNVSMLDFSDVSVAGQPFGDVAAGAISDYSQVELSFRYAVVELTAGGRDVTGQTLSVGAERFTYRIDVVDLAAGQLAIDVLRD